MFCDNNGYWTRHEVEMMIEHGAHGAAQGAVPPPPPPPPGGRGGPDGKSKGRFQDPGAGTSRQPPQKKANQGTDKGKETTDDAVDSDLMDEGSDVMVETIPAGTDLVNPSPVDKSPSVDDLAKSPYTGGSSATPTESVQTDVNTESEMESARSDMPVADEQLDGDDQQDDSVAKDVIFRLETGSENSEKGMTRAVGSPKTGSGVLVTPLRVQLPSNGEIEPRRSNRLLIKGLTSKSTTYHTGTHLKSVSQKTATGAEFNGKWSRVQNWLPESLDIFPLQMIAPVEMIEAA